MKDGRTHRIKPPMICLKCGLLLIYCQGHEAR